MCNVQPPPRWLSENVFYQLEHHHRPMARRRRRWVSWLLPLEQDLCSTHLEHEQIFIAGRFFASCAATDAGPLVSQKSIFCAAAASEW